MHAHVKVKVPPLLSRQLRRLSLPRAPIAGSVPSKFIVRNDLMVVIVFFVVVFFFFLFAAYLSFSIVSAVKTVAENPYEIDLLTSAGKGTVDGGSQYSPTSPMSLSRVTSPWKRERGGGTCKHWARTLHDWDLSTETVPTWTFNSLE